MCQELNYAPPILYIYVYKMCVLYTHMYIYILHREDVQNYINELIQIKGLEQYLAHTNCHGLLQMILSSLLIFSIALWLALFTESAQLEEKRSQNSFFL